MGSKAENPETCDSFLSPLQTVPVALQGLCAHVNHGDCEGTFLVVSCGHQCLLHAQLTSNPCSCEEVRLLKGKPLTFKKVADSLCWKAGKKSGRQPNRCLFPWCGHWIAGPSANCGAEPWPHSVALLCSFPFCL